MPHAFAHRARQALDLILTEPTVHVFDLKQVIEQPLSLSPKRSNCQARQGRLEECLPDDQREPIFASGDIHEALSTIPGEAQSSPLILEADHHVAEVGGLVLKFVDDIPAPEQLVTDIPDIGWDEIIERTLLPPDGIIFLFRCRSLSVNTRIQQLVQIFSSPGFALAVGLLGQTVAVLRPLVALAWILNPRRRRLSKLSIAILLGSVALRDARIYEAARVARQSGDQA